MADILTVTETDRAGQNHARLAAELEAQVESSVKQFRYLMNEHALLTFQRQAT